MKKNIFQEEMEKNLVKFKEDYQFLPSRNPKKNWQYFDISDNLFPPIKYSFLHYAYENAVPLHDYVNHVRSSQIFGINLFYPILLNEQSRLSLVQLLNNNTGRTDSMIVNYYFEYTCDEDILGEWRGKEAQTEYVTAVDLAFETQNVNGENAIYLVEVKFTEEEFSPCNGYTSRGNNQKTKEYCESRDKLFKNKEMCYLKRHHPRKSERKYLDYFDLEKDFPGQKLTKQCPFISNHQCLRNHALARGLVISKKYHQSFFCLVYHDKNEDIHKEWTLHEELTGNQSEIFSFPASEIIEVSIDKTYRNYFYKRYKLPNS